MSIYSPPKGWVQAPHGGERVWIGLALCWCIILFLAMPYWHFFGKQNSTGESYRVTPQKFVERVKKFIDSNTVDTLKLKYGEFKVCEPHPGGDAYLLAKQWIWEPVLKLKKGQTYRLHISSADVQHGFSLLPLNMNFQILPGYDHVLTLTPRETGEFQIICNEFCGIGHHTMTGRIIVTE
ncbi:MAG: cytochrome C oxidase subunit II [Planctomycetota bacterium]|nr:MAG: cytochrome C oxidase subunit II [Planctomycetota bacterium]